MSNICDSASRSSTLAIKIQSRTETVPYVHRPSHQSRLNEPNPSPCSHASTYSTTRATGARFDSGLRFGNLDLRTNSDTSIIYPQADSRIGFSHKNDLGHR